MFDFSDIQDKDGHKEFTTQERKAKTVASLHAILKPFLLRRVKNDVETSLPKKREYILYAPLTPIQTELYRSIKDGNIRAYLEEKAIERLSGEKEALAMRGRERKGDNGKKTLEIRGGKRKADSGTSTPNKSTKTSRSSTPASNLRGRRSAKKQSYEEVSDRQYFAQLNESSESEQIDEDEQESLDHAKIIAQARKEVNRKALDNTLMQLRLACNSPHHFPSLYPYSQDQDNDPTPSQTLISDSGKMLLLDRLLPYLFAHNHKVLIFSQFTRQLDIVSSYASLRSYLVCRIDGGVKAEDRQQQINAFNSSSQHRLFLLSTRAGGLGINLTEADTVILYDSDWNPQQDLQAQDRAHRIGQTRPVVVYRLATKGTVEQTVLEKAGGKRRLEKVVMRRDKFRSFRDTAPRTSNSNKKGQHDAEEEDLASLLLDDEDDFENYELRDGATGDDVLTDEDLRVLTDRSDGAYVRAAKGLDAGERFRAFERGDGEGLMGGLGR